MLPVGLPLAFILNAQGTAVDLYIASNSYVEADLLVFLNPKEMRLEQVMCWSDVFHFHLSV